MNHNDEKHPGEPGLWGLNGSVHVKKTLLSPGIPREVSRWCNAKNIFSSMSSTQNSDDVTKKIADALKAKEGEVLDES